MPFSDDVQKALVAGAFGLVGTLIPAAISWSHDRSAVSARNRTLEEATKRLAFWEQWLKVASQVTLPGDPTPDQLNQELILLREIVQKDSFVAHRELIKLQGKTSEFQNKLGELSLWRRMLLLYQPPRATAWFPRIFFYLGLFAILIIPFGFAAPQDPLSLKDFTISEIAFLVWALIFRSLSRWLEQPRQTPNSGIPAAPPPKPV